MRSWETKREGWTHYVHVDGRWVTVGEHAGSGHSDNAGRCTLAEFLAGRYADDIRATQGPAVLAEVEAAARAYADGTLRDPATERAQSLADRLHAIPVEPTLAEAWHDPAAVQAVYGNLGGYRTEVATTTHVLTFERMAGSVRAADNETPVAFPAFASRAIAWRDRFLVIVDDQYAEVTTDGTVRMAPGAGALTLGADLRIATLVSHPDMVLMAYRWFDGALPAGLLGWTPERGLFARRDGPSAHRPV